MEEEVQLPEQLHALSSRIDEKPESLATGSTEIQLAALQAAKYVFDLALSMESKSRAQITELLASISPENAPRTRSRTVKGQKQAKRTPPAVEETPLSELCIDGMDDEQLWAQLDLKAGSVCKVLEYVLEETGEKLDSRESDGEEQGEKNTEGIHGDDDIDMETIDWDGEGGDSEEEDSDEDDDEEDEDEDEEDDEEDVDEVGLGEELAPLRDPSDEEELDLDAPPLGKKLKSRKGKGRAHSELDDGFFDLAAFNAETEAAEARTSSKGRLGEDEDEEEDLGEEVDIFASVDDLEGTAEEEPELFYKDFFAAPSKLAAKGPHAQHKSTSPTKAKKTTVRFNEEVRVKKVKAKGRNMPMKPGNMSLSQLYELAKAQGMLGEDGDNEDLNDDDDDEDNDINESEGDEEGMDVDEDEDEDQDEMSIEEDVGSDEAEGDPDSDDYGFDTRETIERLKDDLFADDDDDDKLETGLSTHEKRMASLQEEIANLESENVAKKHWTLMGEATSRSRPQNALLEEDLEFERVMKTVPVITEETVSSLEELIKSRILENRFDDVVRKRPVDDKPFLPSRFFELQDTKSKQSLAEIYEDEYVAAQSGGVAGEDRDGKLMKEHEEIEKLWEGICHKLDSLCNAHFTPKAPKATISTVSNVSVASLESALPTTQATSTLLAPEEVFAPSSASLRARSELTPKEKQALHNKVKKAKKRARDVLEKSVDRYAKKARGVGDVKKQKEEALKSVVKSGKGVTVVGKKNKEIISGNSKKKRS